MIDILWYITRFIDYILNIILLNRNNRKKNLFESFRCIYNPSSKIKLKGTVYVIYSVPPFKGLHARFSKVSLFFYLKIFYREFLKSDMLIYAAKRE